MRPKHPFNLSHFQSTWRMPRRYLFPGIMDWKRTAIRRKCASMMARTRRSKCDLRANFATIKTSLWTNTWRTSAEENREEAEEAAEEEEEAEEAVDVSMSIPEKARPLWRLKL